MTGETGPRELNTFNNNSKIKTMLGIWVENNMQIFWIMTQQDNTTKRMKQTRMGEKNALIDGSAPPSFSAELGETQERKRSIIYIRDSYLYINVAPRTKT